MLHSINLSRQVYLQGRMLVAKETVRSLLSRISQIEADTQLSVIEKLSEIKKIQEEMTKVGTEIDSIKKEITLLNTYYIN